MLSLGAVGEGGSDPEEILRRPWEVCQKGSGERSPAVTKAPLTTGLNASLGDKEERDLPCARGLQSSNHGCTPVGMHTLTHMHTRALVKSRDRH